MRDAGARIDAQDEGSCVVFGRPNEALRLEVAERMVSSENVAGLMVRARHLSR